MRFALLQRRQRITRQENHQMAQQRRLLSASTLSGDKVFNPAGEDLGKIEDFMLDMESGRIVYAVLSFGGVFGVGDKLFAVPPEALSLDEDKRCFVLDANKSDLKNAPGFEKDDWPDFADRGWGTQVYSYYGRKPYWT
jgi:sporulation protein YlmC with PRC-barrel domain